jgi:hypothetical protein
MADHEDEAGNGRMSVCASCRQPFTASRLPRTRNGQDYYHLTCLARLDADREAGQ